MSDLKVGDIHRGIKCSSLPYLTDVGDVGTISDKEETQALGRYRVIEIYRDPMTGETREYDIEIIKVFEKPKDLS